MQTIEVQIIENRLAILHNGHPCLWVAGGEREWRSYIERKEGEGCSFIWRA